MKKNRSIIIPNPIYLSRIPSKPLIPLIRSLSNVSNYECIQTRTRINLNPASDLVRPRSNERDFERDQD